MTFLKKNIFVPGLAFLTIFAVAPNAFADIDEADVVEADVEIEAPAEAEAVVVEESEAPAEAEAVVVEESEAPAEAEAVVVEESEAPAEAEAVVVEESEAPAEAAQTAESETACDGITCEQVGLAILMWLPNRLLDLADCFTLGIGLGLDARVSVQATQYCKFGAGFGNFFLLDWTYHRQIGSAAQEGWNANFLCFGVEDVVRTNATVTMNPYWIDFVGVQLPTDSAYALKARDFWAIGGEAGLFWNVRAYIHPVEIADFICGIFFIDVISEDDLTIPCSEPMPDDTF